MPRRHLSHAHGISGGLQTQDRFFSHLLQRAVRVEGLALAVAVEADVAKLDLLFNVAHQPLGIREVLHVRDEEPGVNDKIIRTWENKTVTSDA